MSRADVEVNISVTFRHTNPTEALKKYASDKVRHSLEKFLSHNADVHVILDVEKHDQFAEVIVASKGNDVSAKASTADLYTSIDKMCAALEAQLRKRKDKATSRKVQSASF
jgi:putative sigma-54 modulation protein